MLEIANYHPYALFSSTFLSRSAVIQTHKMLQCLLTLKRFDISFGFCASDFLFSPTWTLFFFCCKISHAGFLQYPLCWQLLPSRVAFSFLRPLFLDLLELKRVKHQRYEKSIWCLLSWPIWTATRWLGLLVQVTGWKYYWKLVIGFMICLVITWLVHA